MSLECSECERDMRGPHDVHCSKFTRRWTVGPQNEKHSIEDVANTTILLPENSAIFITGERHEELAGFIVRAVNSHAALIEAVEGGLAHALPHDECDWVKQARAALRLAKGE